MSDEFYRDTVDGIVRRQLVAVEFSELTGDDLRAVAVRAYAAGAAAREAEIVAWILDQCPGEDRRIANAIQRGDYRAARSKAAEGEP